jgi:hypothetical protein
MWQQAHGVWHRTAEKVVLDFLPRYTDRVRHQFGVLISLSGSSPQFARKNKNALVHSEPIHPLDHNVPRTVLTETTMDTAEHHRNDVTESNTLKDHPRSMVVETDFPTKESQSGFMERNETVRPSNPSSIKQEQESTPKNSDFHQTTLPDTSKSTSNLKNAEKKPSQDSVLPGEIHSSSSIPSPQAQLPQQTSDLSRAETISNVAAVDITEQLQSSSARGNIMVTNNVMSEKSQSISASYKAIFPPSESPEGSRVGSLFPTFTGELGSASTAASAIDDSPKEDPQPDIEKDDDIVPVIQNGTLNDLDQNSFNATDFNSDVDADVPLPDLEQVEPVPNDSALEEKEDLADESVSFEDPLDESTEPFIDNGVEFMEDGTDH